MERKGKVAAVLAAGLAIGSWVPGITLTPKTAEFLLYLQTGHVVRCDAAADPEFAESPEPVFPAPTQPPTAPAVQAADPPEEPEVPCFSPADGAGIQMKYLCSLRPDLGQLTAQPLRCRLTGQEPTVLILHTHATESYTQTDADRYTESAAFRTLEQAQNMVSIGDRLTELLEEGGIHVLHDRALHDYPSYNDAYDNARQTTLSYLAQYPSIRLVLDLHRDAAGDIDHQMKTCATVAGSPSAQLMLVMGTEESGQEYPNWQENLSLGLKLYVLLERKNPGICRSVNLRSYRFNQDLSPGALLIEVGAAGNTRQEALTATGALAEAILALSEGTQENSTP